MIDVILAPGAVSGSADMVPSPPIAPPVNAILRRAAPVAGDGILYQAQLSPAEPFNFPVLTSKPLSLFFVAPYADAAGQWQNHDSQGASGARGLVYSIGVPAPTPAAAVNGRTPAYFVSTASELLDLATLAWTGAWTPNFPASGPWLGTASAGTSGAHTASLSGADPVQGTAVNGYIPAHYDPDNAQDLLTYVPASDLVGSIGTVVILAKVTGGAATVGVSAGAGNPYADPGFTGSSDSALQISYSTDFGVEFGIFDALTASPVFVDVAMATDVWALIQMKWDGSRLYGRVNSGAWTSTPCNGSIISSSQIAIGGNPLINYLAFDALEFRYADTCMSDATCDRIGLALQTRYALSLGF